MSNLERGNSGREWKAAPEKSIQTRIDEARSYREAAQRRWDDASRLVEEAKAEWAKWANEVGGLLGMKQKMVEVVTKADCCGELTLWRDEGLVKIWGDYYALDLKGIRGPGRPNHVKMDFCPFCGAKLPVKKKVEWLSDLPGAIG